MTDSKQASSQTPFHSLIKSVDFSRGLDGSGNKKHNTGRSYRQKENKWRENRDLSLNTAPLSFKNSKWLYSKSADVRDCKWPVIRAEGPGVQLGIDVG